MRALNTELLYQIQRLGMAGAVLHVGAHPDDEDVGLMAYMARHRGVRMVYWSATRGEGGENRIGPYKGDALGLYRTWESLAAREVDGGEAMYGPFYDFGFSKFGEETLEKWGRTNLVCEIVRAIRLVQPALVLARWSGAPQDGHGHHLAIGMVIEEAFDAAGDPACFPTLGLPAWQPQKLYISTMGDWAPGETVTFGQRMPDYEGAGFVRVNTGIFDPIAGRTYQEQAWIGFNSHKTQAMGFAPAPGEFYYYYALRKSLVPTSAHEQDLFDGLDATLTGLAAYPGGLPDLCVGLEQVKAQVCTALEQYRRGRSLQAADALLTGLRCLRTLRQQLVERLNSDATWALDGYLARKIAEFEAAAAHCLGLRLECLADDARVTPGQQFYVSARLWNHADVTLENVVFALHTPEGWAVAQAPTAGLPAPLHQPPTPYPSATYQVTVAERAALATPYWLRQPHGPFAYQWENKAWDGLPFGPPTVELSCRVVVAGQALTLAASVVKREAFVGGFRELPVAVVPPISIHPRIAQAFLPVADRAQQLELGVVLRSNMEHTGIEGSLQLIAPPGWQVSTEQVAVTLGKTGDARTLTFTISIPPYTAPGCYPLRYVVQCCGRAYDMLLDPVRMVAPGLPGFPDETNGLYEEFITTPAVVNVHLIAVEFVPQLKYAYIRGSAEQILESLTNFPPTFQILEERELAYVDLQPFHAVVIGPDAYLVRDELRKNAGRFLEYTAQGGALLVLRQGYAYQKAGYAPYPLHFHEPNDEVTDEAAPVTLLRPEHELLRQPNLISAADFADWVTDRGNFFMGEWDALYTALLSCHDPGEEAKAGGLLTAAYGEGIYVYCAYSLMRQLPAGTPGAFRLLANLLAVPMARVLERACQLARAPFFAWMSKEELIHVARIASERNEKADVYLCHEGDPADAMYIVLQGAVTIIKESEEQRVIAVAQVGETIGELGMLGGFARHAAMRAQDDVHLLMIGKRDFEALLHKYPGLSLRVIQVLAGELAAAGSY